MTSSPLLDLPGAVEADGPDSGVAAHYGQPVVEQRRLLDGSAAVDLSHHDVLRISGQDRLSWLNDITSQNFATLEPHSWTSGMILGPKGRIEYAFGAYDDGEQVWLHTENGAQLLEFLTSMVFINRVQLELVTEDWALIGTARAIEGDPEDETGAELSRRVIPRDELAKIQPSGLWAWEALRIAAGTPRIGLDTDDKTIPNEIGMPGVALDKGCYPGQETVLKVYNLGRPPRRLVRLNLDGSVDRLPERGAAIHYGQKAVGWVGTSARHHELGPVALGLIKRNTDTDAELLVDGIAATQDIVVDPDVGLHVRPVLE